jgi:hypothetical protein
MWVMPSGQDLIIDSTAQVTISDPGYVIVSNGDLEVHGLLDGDGDICVHDSSFNYGVISGTVDICPALTTNIGIVGPGVTYCAGYACTVSIPEGILESGVMAYPIPALDQVFLKGSSIGDRVVIKDIQGRVLLETMISVQDGPISIAELPSGLYLISLLRTGRESSMKLIVE